MSIRLQVVLSRAGIASRRTAEKMIEDGRVAVNGEVVREQGTKVEDADVVTLDGEVVGPKQDPVTLVMFKPAEVVTTMSDPEGRETVADIVRNEPYRLVPVGRLDYLTEGLLLMSTDGELIERLLHPRHKVPKIYVVKTVGTMGDEAVTQLIEGVELEDGVTHPAVVEVLEQTPRRTWIEIVVTEGRNRLVRRMCEAVGHEALRVVRTAIGTIDLGDLKPGQYRYLTAQELGALYKAAGLEKARRFEPANAGYVIGKARRGKGAFPGYGNFVHTTVVEREPTGRN
ncbi:MAG: pseudouridine synthase, partial [Deltaproteobacteria bacterium]